MLIMSQPPRCQIASKLSILFKGGHQVPLIIHFYCRVKITKLVCFHAKTFVMHVHVCRYACLHSLLMYASKYD